MALDVSVEAVRNKFVSWKLDQPGLVMNTNHGQELGITMVNKRLVMGQQTG